MGSTVGSAVVALLLLLAEAAVVFSGVGLLTGGVGGGVQVESSSVALSSLPLLGVVGEMEVSLLPSLVLLVSGETEASLPSSLLILSLVCDLLLMGRERHSAVRRISVSKHCSFILSDVQVGIA